MIIDFLLSCEFSTNGSIRLPQAVLVDVDTNEIFRRFYYE